MNRLIVCCALVAGAAKADLIVQTASGYVEGIPNGVTEEWRGIPYAAAPPGEHGELRWSPPRPPASWTGVRPAKEFGSECFQGNPDEGWPVEGSEDCLYLNVFRPAGTAANAGLPVVVHIHGGGNFCCSAMQDVSAFTVYGVIVVNMNYRLGDLGWLTFPALTAEQNGTSGNYGLQDQIAALRWAHDNVRAFGGDPDNITLMGFSAGAFDAQAIMVSPLARDANGVPLFARVAHQYVSHGSVYGTGSHLADFENIGNIIAGRVGCDTAPDMAVCMRALPADVLQEATMRNFNWDTGPAVGGTGLPQSPFDAVTATGGPTRILLGSDREEWGWNLDSLHNDMPDGWTESQWVHTTDDMIGTRAGSVARRMYPFSAYADQWHAAAQLNTDVVATCPSRAMALASRQPTWRYLYTRALVNDPDNEPWLIEARAAHGTEDFMLWAPQDMTWPDGYPMSAGDIKVSNRMRAYWTNFIKGGDPNGLGLDGQPLPPWPRFDQTGQVEQLDEPAAVTGGFHDAQCDALDKAGAISEFRCTKYCRGFFHSLGLYTPAQMRSLF